MDALFQKNIFSIASTLILLLPIITGFCYYKFLNFYCRTFLLFFCYGFLVNLFAWLSNDIPKLISYLIFNSYSLVESIYLFWFISMTSNSKVLQKIKWNPAILLFPFWIIVHYVINESHKPSSIYTTYLIAISFLSGFAILKFIENETKGQEIYFWIKLGIFINSFGTFFTSSLLETEISRKLWFLQNIINIIAYLIFVKAFSVSKPIKITS